jgi:hypothetical protein
MRIKADFTSTFYSNKTIFISVSANNGPLCLPNLKYLGFMRKPLKNYTEMNRFGTHKI